MSLIIFLCACFWDQVWGEMPSRVHPVVGMGRSIKAMEQLFLGQSPRVEKVAGILIALLIPLFWGGLVFALLMIPNALIHFAVATFFLKASFALKALLGAGEFLKEKLAAEDLAQARTELKSLCSRDAGQLDRQDLLEAGTSSLAENLCDSVVAPLFYYLLGGVPAAIAYRAVNTLDAMIGYRNHYRHLGWASARLDDVLNWIPARLTVLFLLLSGAIQHYPWPKALRIARRDHALTPSPNGGWPMATLAGLLNIRLRKAGVYELGHDLGRATTGQLTEALRVTRLSGRLCMAFVAIIGLGGAL